MACGTKPLRQPMLTHCQLDPLGPNLKKKYIQEIAFQKCCMKNVSHFVWVSMCIYNLLLHSDAIWRHRSGSTLTDGIKSLPEPLLIYHQRCSVRFT